MVVHNSQYKAPAKRSQHFNATYRNLLSATCCVGFATLMRRVRRCWLKFENGQIFHATFVDVAGCCSRLARSVQQCCAWALPTSSIFNSQHARRNTLQQGGQTRATCCAQKCCDLLRLNVAIVWSELANAGPTLLRDVALRCCYCLAGT